MEKAEKKLKEAIEYLRSVANELNNLYGPASELEIWGNLGTEIWGHNTGFFIMPGV